jgi:two-component system, sensor histidine kinase and response regulator
MDRRTTTVGTAGERGGGLGLLLCQDLVERQEGLLSVTSTPGKGAMFRIVLANAAMP